ncbi:MAG: molybdopterin-dependent oxidoreductase [Anaerolineales bacterium]
MNQKRWILFVLAIATLLILTACGSGAPDVDWELSITGDVSQPQTYSFTDLAGMDQVDLNEILMEKSTGEDEVTSWSGVSLEVLLTEAGAGDFATLTALAADGYAIEIPAGETNDAIIALKDNGEWIADVTPDKGPVRLVTPDTPANRWVFQVTDIQVNQ